MNIDLLNIIIPNTHMNKKIKELYSHYIKLSQPYQLDLIINHMYNKQKKYNYVYDNFIISHNNEKHKINYVYLMK